MNLSNQQVFEELHEKEGRVLNVFLYKFNENSSMVAVKFLERYSTNNIYVSSYTDNKEALKRASELALRLNCKMENHLSL